MVSLQWISAEALIEDYANWVHGGRYAGPVVAFDTFNRQESRFDMPLPDNFPMPEPSDRLRVYKGYEQLPRPIGLLYVGDEACPEIIDVCLRSMGPGDIVIFETDRLGVEREGIPLLYSGNQVAMLLT